MKKKRYTAPCLDMERIELADMIALSIHTPSNPPTYNENEGDGSDATAKGSTTSIWDE